VEKEEEKKERRLVPIAVTFFRSQYGTGKGKTA